MWTAPITIAAPAAEPIELAAAKEFLRIDLSDTSFDAELVLAIAGIRDEVERITGTRLVEQTLQLGADTFADLLRLPIGPVLRVTEIAYEDRSGAMQIIDPVTYELTGADLDRGLRTRVGQSWPSDARPAAGAIRVTVVVGYEVLPPSIAIPLLRAVKAEFEGTAIALEPMLVNCRIWL